MKKNIFILVTLIFIMTLYSGCGGENDGQTPMPVTVTDTQTESPGTTKPQSVTPTLLTVDEARTILQTWADAHPFQFSSELDPDSYDHIVDGMQYHLLVLNIIRLGGVEILVHKETGGLFHLTSPGNMSFEPLDDWYKREHGFPQAEDHIEWTTVTTDWMCIDIPSTWSWSYGPDYPDLVDIDIVSENGSMHIFVGYMIAGDPAEYIAENPSEPFIFENGTIGYMLELSEQIMWLNPDLFLGFGVLFNHDGNRDSFTDNEDLILQIARSYRSN